MGEGVLFPMRYYLSVRNAVGKTRFVVRLGAKGRMVLPAEVREALDLKGGSASSYACVQKVA